MDAFIIWLRNLALDSFALDQDTTPFETVKYFERDELLPPATDHWMTEDNANFSFLWYKSKERNSVEMSSVTTEPSSPTAIAGESFNTYM